MMRCPSRTTGTCLATRYLLQIHHHLPGWSSKLKRQQPIFALLLINLFKVAVRYLIGFYSIQIHCPCLPSHPSSRSNCHVSSFSTILLRTLLLACLVFTNTRPRVICLAAPKFLRITVMCAGDFQTFQKHSHRYATLRSFDSHHQMARCSPTTSKLGSHAWLLFNCLQASTACSAGLLSQPSIGLKSEYSCGLLGDQLF